MSDPAYSCLSLAKPVALIALVATLVGCTVNFWQPGNRDAQVDAGPLPDGAPPPDANLPDATTSDGAVDAAVPTDAAPPVPDGGCPGGTKECAATCVTLDLPAYGCADPGCDPCLYNHATAQCVAGA